MMTRIMLTALMFAAITTMPTAGAAPLPCCWAPQNQWDLRCVGTRFSYPPGYSSSDPGTWGPYSPWQGDCLSVGGNPRQR
jgi:hypothetical protein